LDNEDSSENAPTYTLASLSTGSSGNIAVPQHVNFSHHLSSFVNYNLYEFAALVDIVNKNTSSSTKNNNSLFQDGLQDDQTPPTNQCNKDRQSNGTFSLTNSHLLFLRDEARLRS
jgi:hypothetical protein